MQNRKIPWARFAVEGALVVGSILLAFSIDAWWDSRRDYTRGRALLENLAEEFRANRATQDMVIGWHETAVSAAEQLLEVAGGGQLPSELNPDSVLAEVFLTGVSYNPSSGALDSYLALEPAGRGVDPELRSLIASWSGLVEDVAEDEIRISNLIDDELSPYLVSNGSVSAALAAAPDLRGEYPEARYSNDLVTLSGSRQFENLVARRLGFERWALVEHERLRLKLDSILGGLEVALGRR